MRGKASLRSSSNSARGITPAHAGKSFFPSITLIFHRDHPRPCGEKLSIFYVNASREGSPPPMRGKAGIVPIVCVRYGITPAHAGKRYGKIRGSNML